MASTDVSLIPLIIFLKASTRSHCYCLHSIISDEYSKEMFNWFTIYNKCLQLLETKGKQIMKKV